MKFDVKSIIILVLATVLFTMLLPVLSYVISDNFTQEECEICEENNFTQFEEGYLYITLYDDEGVNDIVNTKILYEDLETFTTTNDFISFFNDYVDTDIYEISYENATWGFRENNNSTFNVKNIYLEVELLTEWNNFVGDILDNDVMDTYDLYLYFYIQYLATV